VRREIMICASKIRILGLSDRPHEHAMRTGLIVRVAKVSFFNLY
jgi:hypothetical protein